MEPIQVGIPLKIIQKGGLAPPQAYTDPKTK